VIAWFTVAVLILLTVMLLVASFVYTF
jgi:hypothetical protein